MAVSTIRCVVQDGQTPRPLQEYAKEVTAAFGAVSPGKAQSKNATLDVSVKLPLGDAGNTAIGNVIVQRQPDHQMALHGAVEQCAFRSPAAIDGTLGRAAREACFVGTSRDDWHGRPDR